MIGFTMHYDQWKDREVKEQITYNLMNIVKSASKKHHQGSQYKIKNVLLLPSLNMLDLRVMEKLNMVGKRTNIVAVEKTLWIARRILTALRERGYRNVTVIREQLHRVSGDRLKTAAPKGFDFAYIDSCNEPTSCMRNWLYYHLRPNLAEKYFLATNWGGADRSNCTSNYSSHHPAAQFSINDAAGRYANALSLTMDEGVYDLVTYKEYGQACAMNLCLQTNYSDDCKFGFNSDLRNLGYKNQQEINQKCGLLF